MSFHKSLISKIKNNQRNEVYILLQQLIPENSYIMTELKKKSFRFNTVFHINRRKSRFNCQLF